jgi:hypothetical protein
MMTMMISVIMPRIRPTVVPEENPLTALDVPDDTVSVVAPRATDSGNIS